MSMDIFNPYAPQDLPKVRSFDVPNGRKITLKQEDQYGFWQLHLDKGQLPAKFTGQYTSRIEAEKAIELYRREKGETKD